MTTAEITLRAIFDDYNILLEPSTEVKACLPIMTHKSFKRDYHVLDRKQEKFWHNEFKSDNYIFTLKYSLFLYGSKNEKCWH